MRILSFLLNTDNRLLSHILFWLAYYLQRVFFYIVRYPTSPVVQFMELLVKIPIVYLNLYVFLPYLLKKRRTFAYALSIGLVLLIDGLGQLELIHLMMQWGIYGSGKAFTMRRYVSVTFNIAGVVFLTSLIKILKDAYQNQQVNQALIREKLETELKLLKMQINPHFLFNTLNNLYSLVLIKSSQAPEMLLRLSDLMRYLIYDSEDKLVSLKKEISHLEDYIALEKLRFGEELKFAFETEGDFSQASITPMLFLPFLENAFKHSNGGQDDEIYIRGKIIYHPPELTFTLENSIHPKHRLPKTEASGLGLKNIQRRLELSYPQKYQLDIKKEDSLFKIYLNIQIP